MQLELFISELEQGDMSSFKYLSKLVKEDEIGLSQISSNYINFLKDLFAEFEQRFEDFKEISHLIGFTTKPFEITVTNLERICKELGFDTKATIREFIELNSKLEILSKSEQELIASSNHFRKLYFSIKSFYPDSYLCEKAFSNMNFILNQYRSRLTQENIKNLLVISLTNLIPNMERIVLKLDCQI